MKARRLIKPIVTHISLVRKGANDEEFIIAKSDDIDGELFNTDVMEIIEKKDMKDGKHILKCIVYTPFKKDLQGDFMTPEDIEYFAHNFMKNYRNIDHEHNFKEGFGEVVEGYVFDMDAELNGKKILKNSFLIGIEVNEEVFAMVKSGEITGVSLAGKSKVSYERINKSEKDDSIIEKIIKGILNGLQKKDVDTEEVLEDVGEVDGDENKLKYEEDGMNEEQVKAIVEEMIDKNVSTIVKDAIDEVGQKFEGELKKSAEADKTEDILKAIKDSEKRIKAIEKSLKESNQVIGKSDEAEEYKVLA